MNRRKVLLLSGSAVLSALSIPAFAATAPVLHAYPDALLDVLPDDLPYEEIVAVNEAFNFFDAFDFTLDERTATFCLNRSLYADNAELRDFVIAYVTDYCSLEGFVRVLSIGRIGRSLEGRFPNDVAAQRAFLDAPSDQFSFSGISLREKMTSGDYYDIARAADIIVDS